jgi:hypothetical protein
MTQNIKMRNTITGVIKYGKNSYFRADGAAHKGGRQTENTANSSLVEFFVRRGARTGHGGGVFWHCGNFAYAYADNPHNGNSPDRRNYKGYYFFK